MALRPTGIPAYAGAWTPTEAQPQPPEQYLVYTTMTHEAEHWDDAPRCFRVYVYLNLWSAKSPTVSAAAVRGAMGNAGFGMLEESYSYNAEAKQTLVSWTWVLQWRFPLEAA
jgi:hypothetical protein